MKDWNLDADALAAAPDIFENRYGGKLRYGWRGRLSSRARCKVRWFQFVMMGAGTSFLSRLLPFLEVGTGSNRDSNRAVPGRSVLKRKLALATLECGKYINAQAETWIHT